MSMSSFLYRDVLKYVLPSILFFFLLFTLLNQDLETDLVVSIGTLLSLIFGCIVDKPSEKLFKIFISVRNTSEVVKWMNANWNLDKVFYYLDKEERDYLYLTGAYIGFFRNTGLVLFMYSL
jgi:hypothetical protein